MKRPDPPAHVDPHGEMRVLVGVPTAGATLANRLGAARVPDGWREADHYVLIAACATTVPEANVAPNLHTRALDDAVARLEADINQTEK